MTDVRTICTQADLDELTSSNRYVLVEVEAPWCRPREHMASAFYNLAGEERVEGRLEFARIDLTETPDIAENYGIHAPEYVVLVDGKRPAEPQEYPLQQFSSAWEDSIALTLLVQALGEKARMEDV